MSISGGGVRRIGDSNREQEERSVRFLMYKLDDERQAFPQLDEAQQAAMAEVAGDAAKAGVLVMNSGIAPSATGVIISVMDGETSVTDGPFTEAKEMVGGFGVLECRDQDEAVEWAKRFQAAAGDGEMRVRQLYG
jgi:hypothetical protein